MQVGFLAASGSGFLRFILTDPVLGSDVDSISWCNSLSHPKAKFLDSVKNLKPWMTKLEVFVTVFD